MAQDPTCDTSCMFVLSSDPTCSNTQDRYPIPKIYCLSRDSQCSRAELASSNRSSILFLNVYDCTYILHVSVTYILSIITYISLLTSHDNHGTMSKLVASGNRSGYFKQKTFSIRSLILVTHKK